MKSFLVKKDLIDSIALYFFFVFESVSQNPNRIEVPKVSLTISYNVVSIQRINIFHIVILNPFSNANRNVGNGNEILRFSEDKLWKCF